MSEYRVGRRVRYNGGYAGQHPLYKPGMLTLGKSYTISRVEPNAISVFGRVEAIYLREFPGVAFLAEAFSWAPATSAHERAQELADEVNPNREGERS